MDILQPIQTNNDLKAMKEQWGDKIIFRLAIFDKQFDRLAIRSGCQTASLSLRLAFNAKALLVFRDFLRSAVALGEIPVFLHNTCCICSRSAAGRGAGGLSGRSPLRAKPLRLGNLGRHLSLLHPYGDHPRENGRTEAAAFGQRIGYMVCCSDWRRCRRPSAGTGKHSPCLWQLLERTQRNGYDGDNQKTATSSTKPARSGVVQV